MFILILNESALRFLRAFLAVEFELIEREKADNQLI